MKSKKLNLIESTMLIAGAGIGTGILTLPYAINKIGIFGTIIALVIAYLLSLILYIYIADLSLKSKEKSQILGILNEHILKDNKNKILSFVFFVALILILLENLIVYILCAADIITDLFGIPILLSKIIFYALASIIILLGIKGIGIGEKYSVGFIAVVILTLMIISFINPQRGLDISFGSPSIVIAVFGLFMFAFSAIFSVIQVANNIENVKDLKKALVGGLSINAILTILFAIAAIVGSKEITEVATIGIVNTFGVWWIKIGCSVFILLAMFSSFWSSGLAFADIVKDQFKVKDKMAWLISTIPTLILTIIFPLSILEYVQIGAGALSIMLGMIILPAYYHAITNTKEELLLGKIGKSKILIWVEGIGIIVMAISSFISIS